MRLTAPRAALALLGLSLTTLCGRADAARVKPPVLTADTTITTSTSGWVDVALRDDAVLSPKTEQNPDATITGVGRYVVFWIESLNTGYDNTDSLEVTRYPSWLGGRTTVVGSYDGKQTCSPVLPAVPVSGLESCTRSADRILLHEGFYRITVLADGAPVSLHLDLGGVRAGSTTVRPTHELASAERELPMFAPPGGKTVSFGGTSHTTKAEPRFLLTDLKRSGDTGIFEDGQCVRQDVTEAPAAAYSPPCAGGSGTAWYEAKVNGTGTGWFYYTPVVAYAPSIGEPYDTGLGGSYSDSLGLTLNHALGVWLQPTP